MVTKTWLVHGRVFTVAVNRPPTKKDIENSLSWLLLGMSKSVCLFFVFMVFDLCLPFSGDADF